MSVTGELLTAAKELLSKGRTKGALARDKDGNAVDPSDKTAERYSVSGALMRAAWDCRDSSGIDAAFVLLGASNVQDRNLDGISTWADDEALFKRFDEAIARADGKPLEPKKPAKESGERQDFDPLAGGGEEVPPEQAP